MSLSDEQRVRYARHLLLPELGEAGQLKLLAGRVRFAGGVAEGAREVAEEYLRRAGVRVSDHDHDHESVWVMESGGVECEPSLKHAADALAGAFAAVEAIKELAGIGKPGTFDRNLLRAEEV